MRGCGKDDEWAGEDQVTVTFKVTVTSGTGLNYGSYLRDEIYGIHTIIGVKNASPFGSHRVLRLRWEGLVLI